MMKQIDYVASGGLLLFMSFKFQSCHQIIMGFQSHVIRIPVMSSNHHGISESCHSNSSHVIKSLSFKFQSFHQIIMEFQSHVIQIPVMSSNHHGISELCHSNSSHVIKSSWDFRVLSFKFQSCHQFIMEFQPL